MKGKNKLVPRLLGVNKESVLRVDEKTKVVSLNLIKLLYNLLHLVSGITKQWKGCRGAV